MPLKTTWRVHCAEKTGGNLAAFIVVNLISRVACCAAAIKRRVAMAFSDALSACHLAGAGAVRNKGAVTLENLAPALQNKKQPLFSALNNSRVADVLQLRERLNQPTI